LILTFGKPFCLNFPTKPVRKAPHVSIFIVNKSVAGEQVAVFGEESTGEKTQ
jgi:hypothetical protein